MKSVSVVSAALLSISIVVVACSGSKTNSGFNDTTPDKGGGGGGGSSSGNGGGGSSSGGGPILNGGDAGSTGSCAYADGTDHDGDGFSAQDGDCNDCDPNVNPGAFDVPGNQRDEDCNGKNDDDGISCDTGLPLNSADAKDAAKAMGLCRTADPNGTGKTKTWGVLSARYVMPDGQALPDPVGHGILHQFGVNKTQEGDTMVALSSGTARAPTDPEYQDPSGDDKGYTSGTPAGYPKESPACKGVHTGEAHDGAALELTIRVPTNAKSFSFQENFFTYEFPDYICSEYNDFYVAMLTPQVSGLPDGNIAFDQDNNPISVNNSLLQVCTPRVIKQKNFTCPLGPSSLQGTGFDQSAATGWLQTTAPVKPGDTITLLLAIWDSGDGALDSTVLVDKFTWSADGASGATTTPAPPTR
jgi:hypothetical protein